MAYIFCNFGDYLGRQAFKPEDQTKKEINYGTTSNIIYRTMGRPAF